MFNYKLPILFFVAACFAYQAGDTHAYTSKKRYDIRITNPELSFLQPFNNLLQDHVQAGTIKGIDTNLIDYATWQQDPRHQRAMAKLQAANPENLTTTEEEFSFWINTFNLLVIDMILMRQETESVQNSKGIIGDPWRKFFWKVAGEELNLHTIKNKKLSVFKDPRVHFTISEGCLSCPAIKNEVYWPIKIYSQLENASEKYILNDTHGTLIKPPTQPGLPERLRASLVFKWQKSAFKDSQPADFIRQFKPLGKGMKISGYLPFNWDLNTQEGKAPVKDNEE